jgi:hypothetical protein
MADLSDVENAIASGIVGALYPQGISQISAVGIVCRVYRGWPSPAALNADLAAGIVNVTIVPTSTPGEVVDPYLDRSYAAATSTSLLATVTGENIVFSGLVSGNEVVGLLVDGLPISYAASASDISEIIAANLGVAINAGRIAIVSGSTLTIPGVRNLVVRVVTNATVSRGLRRQRREIQVICWCPSPALRDLTCRIIDVALTASSFLGLADGTRTHVCYVSTQLHDQSQNALLYRRDLHYKCEYTTIGSSAAPVMLFGDLFNNGSESFV